MESLPATPFLSNLELGSWLEEAGAVEEEEAARLCYALDKVAWWRTSEGEFSQQIRVLRAACLQLLLFPNS